MHGWQPLAPLACATCSDQPVGFVWVLHHHDHECLPTRIHPAAMLVISLKNNSASHAPRAHAACTQCASRRSQSTRLTLKSSRQAMHQPTQRHVIWDVVGMRSTT